MGSEFLAAFRPFEFRSPNAPRRSRTSSMTSWAVASDIETFGTDKDSRAPSDSDESDTLSGDELNHAYDGLRAAQHRYARKYGLGRQFDTLSRLNAICIKVQKTARPSLDELRELRESLRKRSITNQFDQEDELMQKYQLCHEWDEIYEDIPAWEGAEIGFAADLSRCTMEERFVEDVSIDNDVDLDLLRLLGPELEGQHKRNYQQIDAYFQHKKNIMERPRAHKSSSEGEELICPGLPELETWHGVVPSRQKSLRSFKSKWKKFTSGLMDETHPARSNSRQSTSSKASESTVKSQRGATVAGRSQSSYSRLYMHSKSMGRMMRRATQKRRESSPAVFAAAAASAIAAGRLSVTTVPEPCEGVHMGLPAVSHDGCITPGKLETPRSSRCTSLCTTPGKFETPRASMKLSTRTEARPKMSQKGAHTLVDSWMVG